MQILYLLLYIQYQLFFNTYKFSNHDINKFILLLQKGVYSYEYMDDWEKLNENLLPEEEEFYMENITDSDYAHRKGFVKSLK